MVDASIPMSRYSEIRISSRLDGNKDPLITVIVPGTTLFDLHYDEFVKMVTDYGVSHVPSSKKHVTKTELMSQAEFDGLLEYSTTLPTGTTIGKRWKSKQGGEWHLGEYVPGGEPGHVNIEWKKIRIAK